MYLLRDTSIYTFARIIPQFFSFILLPFYTLYLTTTDYGIVNSMQVLGVFLSLFFTLAIDRSVLRFYYDYDSIIEKKKYLGTISICVGDLALWTFPCGPCLVDPALWTLPRGLCLVDPAVDPAFWTLPGGPYIV